MKITNPKDGADIDVNGLTLAAGETKEFKPSDAEYLLKTFGFLTEAVAKKKSAVLGSTGAAPKAKRTRAAAKK